MQIDWIPKNCQPEAHPFLLILHNVHISTGEKGTSMERAALLLEVFISQWNVFNQTGWMRGEENPQQCLKNNSSSSLNY